MSHAPGSFLGPYEIITAVGAGGMGEVYRARDSVLQRDVAIKVLHTSLANDPDRLARFEREAQILASINHPNIAAIYGFEGGALIMEFVEGATIADRLRKGAIPPAETIAVELQRAQRGHFNLIHHATGFKADIYPKGRDPLHDWALADVRSIELDDVAVKVAPPEYVILRKLEYFREGGSEKHLRDTQAMLTHLGKRIDLPLLESHIAVLGLQPQWKRVTFK